MTRRLWVFPKKLNLPEARELFAQYLEDAKLKPKVWTYEGEQIAYGAPIELAINATLRLHLSDLMNMHPPLLWFMFYAALEAEQKRKILFDERDADNERMAAEMEKEMNASPGD